MISHQVHAFFNALVGSNGNQVLRHDLLYLRFL
jgi:hypothetical protein